MKLRSFLLALSAALAAVSSAQTYVEYGTQLSISIDTFEYDERQGEAPYGPAHAAIDIEGYGSATGVANVGAGVNKAAIAVQGTNAENPLTYASAFASSRYYDSFTLDDPALNGTMGTFTTTLFVRGSGDFRLDESLATSDQTLVDAFWHAVINVDAGLYDEDGVAIYQSAFYAGEWYKDYDETSLQYYGDPLGAYQQEVEFRFVYGQPVYLDTFLQTLLTYDNQSLVAGTFDVDVDLGNSAYWGGLRNVKDASGNVLTGYGYSSASGFDYRLDATPVPEPASMLALAAGIGTFLRRRRA